MPKCFRSRELSELANCWPKRQTANGSRQPRSWTWSYGILRDCRRVGHACLPTICFVVSLVFQTPTWFWHFNVCGKRILQTGIFSITSVTWLANIFPAPTPSGRNRNFPGGIPTAFGMMPLGYFHTLCVTHVSRHVSAAVCQMFKYMYVWTPIISSVWAKSGDGRATVAPSVYHIQNRLAKSCGWLLAFVNEGKNADSAPRVSSL